MNLIFHFLSYVFLYALGIAEAGRGKLVWSDEFNDFTTFSNNWRAEVGGHGWGNNELQYYTNLNARTENGDLVIEARREAYGGMQYTSSRLISKAFTYGVFEIRAKLPKGRGTWPAFWMLGAKRPLTWPLDGEIDIMEHVGYDPNVIHGSIHCAKYNHMINTQKTTTIRINNPFTEYHTYTLEWSPYRIEVSVDGYPYFAFMKENESQESWPFDNAHNIILNLAIGGDWGGVQGVDNTIFPVQYRIDYVRVYEYAADPPASIVSSRQVALKAKVNNKFVCADNAGNSPLIANKNSVGGAWEAFEMTRFNNGLVTLKSMANGKFVSADNNGNSPLIASKTEAIDWERFTLVENTDGTVSFRARVNLFFVMAENFGNSPLIAKSNGVDEWEKFYLTYLN